LNRPRDSTIQQLRHAEPAGGRVLHGRACGSRIRCGRQSAALMGTPNMVPGWPKSEHTIFVDKEHNVYIAGAQAGDTLLKFTADGKFISEFGHRGPAVANNTQKQDNQQTDLLLRGSRRRRSTTRRTKSTSPTVISISA